MSSEVAIVAESAYKIRELPWDTDYFEMKMGEVELFGPDSQFIFSDQKWRRTLELAQKQGYRFLFCQFDTGQHQTLNKMLGSGAIIGDILLTFKLNLKSQPNMEKKFLKSPVIQADIIDLPQILEIAGQSFSYSRFLQDPNFNHEKVDQFYPRWFSESFNRNEQFLVIKENTEVLGFVSFKLQADIKALIIQFIAVKGSARNRGIGQALVNEIYHIAIMEKVNLIQVGTQINNYPAIGLYEKNGFRFNHAKYRLHIWLNH